ncbi:MAG: IclR family transcriptional regulator C-terminal domain-containing protein [Candidatus Nanopelagicales bacterium]
MAGDHEPTLIQSVQRALHLMEECAAAEGRATAKELARRTGLALPTTYHLLRTLVHEGYLQRLEDGSYALGHRMDLVVGRGRAARAVAQARPALEWLRDELTVPVYLALHDDGEIVVAEIVDGPKAPRIDLWVGMHDAAHATALGKCILAHLAEEDREDYLARHPLHRLTPNTTVDRTRLRDDLREHPQIALDREEYAVGVSCAAAPVVTDRLIGSVGFSTTARGRRGDLRRAAEALRETATRVSRTLALA